jgi:hypothetical protein
MQFYIATALAEEPRLSSRLLEKPHSNYEFLAGPTLGN